MRKEKDSIGDYNVEENALWGIYTQRVKDTYSKLSNEKVPYEFLVNYVRVKKVYAEANLETGKLEPAIAKAINDSCDELIHMDKDEFMSHFPINRYQAGGGTSTNMNVNEVIANIAEEKLGGKRGLYKFINPNDHVNMSQSTNDTFPGVMRITTLMQLEKLVSVVLSLKETLNNKSNEFKSIEKVGRTHLQDAVKITLGDEFGAFARTIEKDLVLIKFNIDLILELNLGGTATGSLQNITHEIRELLIDKTAKEFNINFVKPKDYFEMNSSSSDFAKVSGGVNILANDLIKMINDLRLLTSGPRAGFGEIILPEIQNGSSIMPGKVNPSILEAVEMILFKYNGLDHTINLATQNAELQLQQFQPIVGMCLYEGLDLVINSVELLDKKCISGIKVNAEKVQENLDRSFIYATDYSEKLGYKKVSELVKKAYAENLNLKKLIEENSK